MADDKISDSLFSKGCRDQYSSNDAYQNHLLEQYKIYLTSAENISNRRQSANAFFVTINSALVSLVGYINFGGNHSSDLYWLISISGIAISYMWYRLVRSYKDLNSAKFKVVHDIEKQLPLSPYDAEWDAVGRGNDSKLYLPFTHIEIFVPWVFLILHGFVFWTSISSQVISLVCATAS